MNRFAKLPLSIKELLAKLARCLALAWPLLCCLALLCAAVMCWLALYMAIATALPPAQALQQWMTHWRARS